MSVRCGTSSYGVGMSRVARGVLVLVVAALALPLAAVPVGAAPLPVAVAMAPAGRTAPAMSLASVTTLVALGDSVPSGGACGCTPFPNRVAAMLAARLGRGVVTQNDAVGGLTTSRLVNQLRYNPQIRRDVAGAQVVLVTIGANDISSRACGLNAPCYAPIVRRVGQLLDLVARQIKALRNGRATAIVLTNYWNVWRDGAVARRLGAKYVAASVALTRGVNAQVAAAVHRNGLTYVDLWVPFRGTDNHDDTGLLAADGDHPNAYGHQVIALAVARVLARRIPA